MTNIRTDKQIPKSLFKSKLDKNKNSFWVADKENVPVQDDKGYMIPVKKLPTNIYRALPASKLKEFLKKDIKKSKGIYFTSDLGDALTWALIFGEGDTDGAVVLRYTGKMDTKFFRYSVWCFSSCCNCCSMYHSRNSCSYFDMAYLGCCERGVGIKRSQKAPKTCSRN